MGIRPNEFLFVFMVAPLERRNLKEREPPVSARFHADFAPWNSNMPACADQHVTYQLKGRDRLPEGAVRSHCSAGFECNRGEQ